MQLDIVVLFFILGLLVKIIGSNLEFPKGIHQTISIFLMLAIGLKGGIALADNLSASILIEAMLFVGFGALLPISGYIILKTVGNFDRTNAAAVAAHFGSVSIGTYAVAVALLESQKIAYEAYFPLFVVLLEFPAMFIAVILANRKEKSADNIPAISMPALFKKILRNESIVLLFGGLIIGLVAHEQAFKLMPFFNELFHGVLALFLLVMGMDAGAKLSSLKQQSLFLVAFSTFTPLVNGLIGGLFATYIGFSTGGIFLTVVLAASASYIAVPIAMRSLLPTACQSTGITASLGIAFPFNIIAGIPVYWLYAHWLTTTF